MEENRYLNYQGLVTAVTTSIAQLDSICRRISMDTQADELKAVGSRLQNHIFSVGIMGEFRRGKSTVINALLGQKIVPSDIVPTSATLNYVRWDVNKRVEIRFKNGSTKEVPVEELSNYVTKITKESEAIAATVEYATVFYPCPFCQNGVQIVDTPGLNDDECMTAISENVIPVLDAIIMVLVPDSPFSQSEAEFVRSKLMASDLGKLIFVVNKIDIVEEEDRERLLISIKEKIKNSVLEKMAVVYGKDSEEFKKAKEKIGDIKVFPVSARDALKGKLKQNAVFLEESGYLEFEKVLSKMLTEERGLLELMHPVNQILSVSKSILETLHMRQKALDIDAKEYEKIQMESAEKIKETRSKKKIEISHLKAKGKNLYAELLPEVSDIYEETETILTDFVAVYPIADTDLGNKEAIQALSASISKDLDEKLKETLSIHTERLIYKIKEQMGNDMESLKTFSSELEQNLGEIRDSILLKGTDATFGTIGNILFDVGGMYATLAVLGANIPGIGGMLSGWREYGVKGAIAGGLSGVVIGFTAAVLCASAGIFGLPFALIAGTASTFGGKAMTNLIFGQKDKISKKIEGLRQELAVSVHDMVEKLKKSSSIENWLHKTCEEAYDKIAADIDREWETSLSNMEKTLAQIKLDIGMNTANKEKCEKEMKELEQEIFSILDSIKSVQKKLSAVLDD